MKKLLYRLENRATGKVANYETVAELCDQNDWIGVSIHTLSRLKRNSSYANKFCIVTKYDTEVVKEVKAQKIFKIKKQ